MNRSLFAACLFAALTLPAAAQTITNVTIEPAAAKVGEPVKITVNFDKADNVGCNVRLFFGDGGKQDNKINQSKDVPKIVTHTYTKAGEYRVKAEGKTALPLPKCSGDTQSAMVKVAAPRAGCRSRPELPRRLDADGPECQQEKRRLHLQHEAGHRIAGEQALVPGRARLLREQVQRPARLRGLNPSSTRSFTS